MARWQDDPIVASADPNMPRWMSDPQVEPNTNAGRFATPQLKQSIAPSWSEVPGKAISNVGKSAVEFGKSVVEPIMDLPGTAAAFRDIGVGLVSKAKGLFGDDGDPAAKAKREAAADALGAHFAQRYGSIDGLKKTMAEDPVGFLADASIVLTGGGSIFARAPGVAGKAGEVVRAAGAISDPLMMPIRAANAAAQGVGRFASSGLGLATGAGGDSVRRAFDAGRAGGAADDVFTGQMRGTRPLDEVVDMAEKGVEAMGRDRRAAYDANMAATRADRTVIDTSPIAQSIADAYDMATHKGVVVDDAAMKVVREIAEKAQEFGRIGQPASNAPVPAGVRTTNMGPGLVAEDLDAFKKSLNQIRSRTQQGTLERAIVDKVLAETKDQIKAQVPSYAKAMSDYSSASDMIGEARRTLSVSDKASTDTTLRKLQSTTRNNANANFGQRQKLVDEIAQYQPDLPFALAGQALNAKTARGIMGPLSGLYGLSHVSNPASWLSALGQLALTSPRLVGEGAHLAGQGARIADNIVGATASPILNSAAAIGITPERAAQAALISYLVDQAKNDQGTGPRSSLLDLFPPR